MRFSITCAIAICVVLSLAVFACSEQDTGVSPQAADPKSQETQASGRSTEGSIAASLEASRMRYEQEIESAREDLAGAIDLVIQRVESNSELLLEERLAEFEALQDMRNSLLQDGVVLEVDGLGSQIDQYEQALDLAHRRWVIALEDAAKAYGEANKLPEARAVLDELESLTHKVPTEQFAKIDAVEGDVAIASFENGTSVFTNRRDYIIGELPQEVPFSQFTQIPAGGETELEITISRAGWVYIAVALGQRTPANVRPYLDDNRWEATDWSFTRGGSAADCFIFRKQFPRGTITLPRLDWNSPLVLIE